MATGLKGNQTPNFVGGFLKLQVDDYVRADYSVTRRGVFTDLARVMGCTPDALENWYENRNGIKHSMAQKLAFLFEVSLNELADGGEYKAPTSPSHDFSKTKFAYRILQATNLTAPDPDRLRVEDLRRDLRDIAEKHLEKVKKLSDPQKPATTTLGELMPKIETGEPEPDVSDIPEQGEAFFEKAEIKKLEPKPQVLASNEERNQIQLFLHQAEKFRQNNDLEWFVLGGRLRARRVITEEF